MHNIRAHEWLVDNKKKQLVPSIVVHELRGVVAIDLIHDIYTSHELFICNVYMRCRHDKVTPEHLHVA